MKCRFLAAAILVGTLLAGPHILSAQDQADGVGQSASRPTRQTHAHAQSGRGHAGRTPRSGVPTIGDSLFRAASWLQPSNHGQNLTPARFRPARSRRPINDHGGHVHPAHHQGGVHTHAEPVQHGQPAQVANHTVNLEIGEPALATGQETVYEEIGNEILVDGTLGHGACCHPNGSCDTCCLVPFPAICWDNLEVGFGVQGFTGPLNRGETGSFGANQSVNLGLPLPLLCWHEIGGQVGVRGAQSNFSGAEFTNNERRQFFLTAGLFHRVDWGFQGGIVVDYLRDRWYTETDLSQLRGELSWVFPCFHEWGFWFNRHVRDDVVTAQVGVPGALATINEEWESTDVYAFFYRYRAAGIGGEARFFGGFTGDSDGILGVDMRLPVAERWDLDGGFTYLVPEEGTGNRGHEEESWNIGINLIYYPGCRTSCDGAYYRPLFDVADNGTFFIDR